MNKGRSLNRHYYSKISSIILKGETLGTELKVDHCYTGMSIQVVNSVQYCHRNYIYHIQKNSTCWGCIWNQRQSAERTRPEARRPKPGMYIPIETYRLVLGS